MRWIILLAVLMLIGVACTSPLISPTPLLATPTPTPTPKVIYSSNYGSNIMLPLRYISYDGNASTYLLTTELYAEGNYPVVSSALILVDVWDSLIPNKRFYERADMVMPNMLSVLESARANDMLVIHAFEGYPEAKAVESTDKSEPIVSDTLELDSILRQGNITTLFYMGFATNLCVIEKPYGIRKMHELGYKIILIRDCTAAVEYPDTADDECATRSAIRRIEYLYGRSTLSKDFIGGFAD